MAYNAHVYAKYAEEYWTDLSDYVSKFREKHRFLDEFIVNVANETFELAQEYCPVRTGYLKDSLTLKISRHGFIISSDCSYAGYVHEILSYWHEPPTRAGFLIEAFKEVMMDYMSIYGGDIPDFKVDMRAVPLSLTFYMGKKYGGFKTKQSFIDTVSRDNKVTIPDFTQMSTKLIPFEPEEEYNSESVSTGISWTKFFGSGVKTKDYESEDLHLQLISELSELSKVSGPLSPDVISEAVNRMFTSYRGKSFHVSGADRLAEFDEVNT